MEYVKSILGIISVLSGLFAGLFWLKAAIVNIKVNNLPDENGWVNASISDSDGMDFIETAKAQTKWNIKAATVACIAAFCQTASFGIDLLLSWTK